MNRSPWLGLAIASLLVLLAGCGLRGGPPATPSPTPYTGPGTNTGGPVSIATDHRLYGSSDAMSVAVTNGLSVPIYAMDEEASCSILRLETQQLTGDWRKADGAACPLGRTPIAVKIEPRGVYRATIQAGYPGLAQAAFVPGVYRLVLRYATSATVPPSTLLGPITMVTSAELVIFGPQPTATAVQPTTTSGSPTTAETPTPTP